MSLTSQGWTVEMASACAADYGARAEEYEALAREMVHAPYWLDCFAQTAAANRREERYCKQVLKALQAR